LSQQTRPTLRKEIKQVIDVTKSFPIPNWIAGIDNILIRFILKFILDMLGIKINQTQNIKQTFYSVQNIIYKILELTTTEKV